MSSSSIAPDGQDQSVRDARRRHCMRLAIDKLEAASAPVTGPVEKLGDSHAGRGKACVCEHGEF